MRSLRIAVVCYPTAGGSGVVATELARALAARGHRLYLVATRLPFRADPLPPGVAFVPVTIPNYPLFEYPSYGLSVACALSHLARAEPLDLCHVHYAYPHALAALIARQLTGPVFPEIVTTLHGTDITLAEDYRCHRDLVQAALDGTPHLTAVSESLARETAQRFRVPRPITVIPNFIDPAEFNGSDRESPLPPGPPVILHVSNFRPVKRSMDAVRVLAQVRRATPARLLLIGDGPERPAVEAEAARLGVAQDLVWAGERRDIVPWTRGAAVALVTSLREGFGLSALESMAAGLPVVGTRCGGLEEVVRHGEDGFLETVADVPALAGRVAALLRDSALRDAMGTRARARAAEAFHRDRIVDRYEAFYEGVLGGIPPGISSGPLAAEEIRSAGR